MEPTRAGGFAARSHRGQALTTSTRYQELQDLDLAHLIHPLWHREAQRNALIFERGEGIYLYDTEGRRYIDGLSSLWNVNVGHGRRELAEAAAEQMRAVAFTSSYTGYANEPSIRLAAALAEVTYPSLNAVFFSSGGGEANESAFKVARFYWKLLGKPTKTKFISRVDSYHGVTFATMSATGMPVYHEYFSPVMPGFFQAEAPWEYRAQLDRGWGDRTARAVRSIEAIIEREGADTIAAVIAEPVQGAGGVIPPPPDYWRALRDLCDRHDILLIADEVITGFGRTGDWFALTRWGIEPDLMSVAKGINSGYTPLGATFVSDRILEAMVSAPPSLKFMHTFTASGHPVSCAVALRHLQILKEERLAENAARMGERLLNGLKSLDDIDIVGDVRGLGLLAAVGLVRDKASGAPFDPPGGVGARVVAEMRARGVITRHRNEAICFAPPLIIEPDEVDRVVEVTRDAVLAVRAAL